MADLIEAVWRGPFDGERVTGHALHNGDTALVTDRDLESGHWQRVEPEPAFTDSAFTDFTEPDQEADS